MCARRSVPERVTFSSTSPSASSSPPAKGAQRCTIPAHAERSYWHGRASISGAPFTATLPRLRKSSGFRNVSSAVDPCRNQRQYQSIDCKLLEFSSHGALKRPLGHRFRTLGWPTERGRCADRSHAAATTPQQANVTAKAPTRRKTGCCRSIDVRASRSSFALLSSVVRSIIISLAPFRRRRYLLRITGGPRGKVLTQC